MDGKGREGTYIFFSHDDWGGHNNAVMYVTIRNVKS